MHGFPPRPSVHSLLNAFAQIVSPLERSLKRSSRSLEQQTIRATALQSHHCLTTKRTVKWLQSVAIQDLSRSITLMLNGKHYTIRSSDGNKVVAKCMYHNLVFYNIQWPFFIIMLMSDCQTIIHCCGHVRFDTKVSHMQILLYESILYLYLDTIIQQYLTQHCWWCPVVV